MSGLVLKLGPKERVLINGASGGVGTFAVQLAKTLGVHVTGVCSTRNVELVRSLGADDVVDYTKQDFTASAERYDAIIDMVGNRSLSEVRRVLAPEGTYVMVGGQSGEWAVGHGEEGRVEWPMKWRGALERARWTATGTGRLEDE